MRTRACCSNWAIALQRYRRQLQMLFWCVVCESTLHYCNIVFAHWSSAATAPQAVPSMQDDTAQLAPSDSCAGTWPLLATQDLQELKDEFATGGRSNMMNSAATAGTDPIISISGLSVRTKSDNLDSLAGLDHLQIRSKLCQDGGESCAEESLAGSSTGCTSMSGAWSSQGRTGRRGSTSRSKTCLRRASRESRESTGATTTIGSCRA